MPSQLEQLRALSAVVADTGDIDAIARFQPLDATTNPSLLLKAASKPAYASLLDDALDKAQGHDAAARIAEACEHYAVAIGREILQLIPGRVSTECDARLSFDTEATLQQARRLVQLYADAGVTRDRLLIEIAATWEGIRAAEQLEREGIHCNLTLLFSFAQAVACAEAGVTLISPFVGRIYDWYKKERGGDIPADEDPGVASVTRIYNYFKKFGYKTQIMGASFRKVDQIVRLAGCDLLTISPDLLEKLASTQGEVERRLIPEKARGGDGQKLHLDEKTFRWMHNEDPMAVDKLAEGIRKFYSDARKLEQYALSKVTQKAHA